MSQPDAERAAPAVAGNDSQKGRLGGAITKSNSEFPAGFQPKESAERIRGLIASSAADMLAIGDELIRAKSSLDHGEFGVWLRTEFGWTARTAQNFIAAARAFGPNAKSVLYLPVPTLYRLAAPSATTARERVIERVEKGERLPVKEIDAICHEVRERQRQDTVTQKLRKSRGPKVITSPPAINDTMQFAREHYAALLAKVNVAEIVSSPRMLKARIGELKGINAPKPGGHEPFPELPDFLNPKLNKEVLVN